MPLIDWLPVGIAAWGAETFVAVIVLLVLTERLVGRGRLTELREEIALWRTKSERETAINEANAESIKNFAAAAILKEEVRRAIRDQKDADSEAHAASQEVGS